MEEHLWDELLQTLSSQDLTRLLVAVTGDSRDQKRKSKDMKIQSIIKFTLTSQELLNRAGLCKRVLYNFARNKMMQDVSTSMTKTQIVEKITDIWRMRALPLSRIRFNERIECRNILNHLDSEAIKHIWIKLKPCHGKNSSSDVRGDILSSLPSVEWLLHKRCVTKKILEEYLHQVGNTSYNQATRSVLIQWVLEFIRRNPGHLLYQ